MKLNIVILYISLICNNFSFCCCGSNNIFYIERNQRYSYICTNDDIIKTQTSLNELKSKLPNYFIRSHNSYIFNAKYLLEIKRTNIILKNNYNIPISRAYKQSVKEELHDFFIDSL